MCNSESKPNERFKPDLPLTVNGNEVYRFITTHYFHQNQLSWSRLQTQFAVEAGLLTWYFSQKQSPTISAFGMILGVIVIWLLYKLVLRDWEIRDQNENVLKLFHEPLGIEMRIHPKDENKMDENKWLRGLRGKQILDYLTFGCIITNLTLVVTRLWDLT